MHLWKILILSGFLVCIILLPFNVYAKSNTFSVYGTVNEQNGTPIPGTTIKLIEQVNNSHTTNELSSTITDSEGRFQFVNMTTEADVCTVTISYPDRKQYFPPGNSFRSVSASGVQNINITRIPIESDATPGFGTMLTLVGLIVVVMIIRDRKRV